MALELFEKPQHPYTEGLFRSVPRLGGHKERLETIPGTVPNPARFPTGCKFHPRCPRTRAAAATAQPHEVIEAASAGERFKVLRKCATDEPALKEVQRRHWASCHLIEGFERAPVTEPRLDHRREVVARVIDGGAPVPMKVAAGEVTR